MNVISYCTKYYLLLRTKKLNTLNNIGEYCLKVFCLIYVHANSCTRKSLCVHVACTLVTVARNLSSPVFWTFRFFSSPFSFRTGFSCFWTTFFMSLIGMINNNSVACCLQTLSVNIGRSNTIFSINDSSKYFYLTSYTMMAIVLITWCTLRTGNGKLSKYLSPNLSS